MALPIAVLAGSHRLAARHARRRWLAAWCVGGLVAVWLAIPDNPGVSAIPRRVAGGLEDRASGYASLDPSAIQRGQILRSLFALPWDHRVPGRLYGVPALVNLHYACRGTPCTGSRYLLTEASESTESLPGEVIARAHGLELRVLDRRAWHEDRRVRLTSPPGSRFYAMPRGAVFRGGPGGPRAFDLRDLVVP